MKKILIIIVAVIAVAGAAVTTLVLLNGSDNSKGSREFFYADLCPAGQVAVHIEEYSDSGELIDYRCGEKPVCAADEHLQYYGGPLVDESGRSYIASSLSCWSDDESRNDYPALKPIIYLYPRQQTDINVKLNYDGNLFATYPEINDGWRVTAFPDGKIINHADGREYSYLFWEGIPGQERNYDWTKGFVVKGSDVREFLQEKLSEVGLTPTEYNEFIVYWYPKMMMNEYNLVHFASADEYDKYAELNISPKPDSILRVFMVFKKIDKPVKVTPQKFAPFKRDGFTVVEWGGSEIK